LSHSASPCILFYLCIFAVLGFELRAYTVSHSTSPFFVCDGFFLSRVSGTICPGWLWTTILLVSTSWVVRIIGVNHQCLASHYILVRSLSNDSWHSGSASRVPGTGSLDLILSSRKSHQLVLSCCSLHKWGNRGPVERPIFSMSYTSRTMMN
jgi:hypothetical protein